MEGFNLIEKVKLIVVVKKATTRQIKEIMSICEVEIQRRKRKEAKELKNVIPR